MVIYLLMVNGFQETKGIRDTNSHQNISNETIKEIIASNPFHIETRWKVDWTRMPSGWKTWQTVKGIKTIVRKNYYTLDKVLLKG